MKSDDEMRCTQKKPSDIKSFSVLNLFEVSCFNVFGEISVRLSNASLNHVDRIMLIKEISF